MTTEKKIDILITNMPERTWKRLERYAGKEGILTKASIGRWALIAAANLLEAAEHPPTESDSAT